MLAESQKVRRVVASQNRNIQYVREKKWSKPPDRQFQLDVDAGYQDQAGKYNVGAVTIMSLFVLPQLKVYTPGSLLAIELFAIQHGMMLAIQNGFHNVGAFSNSYNDVLNLNSTSEILNHEDLLFLIF